MSGFKKINWADHEDEEDDDDDMIDVEEDNDKDESVAEDDDDKFDLKLIINNNDNEANKKDAIKQLSKKKRKESKKNEFDDLDSLFALFTLTTTTTSTTPTSTANSYNNNSSNNVADTRPTINDRSGNSITISNYKDNDNNTIDNDNSRWQTNNDNIINIDQRYMINNYNNNYDININNNNINNISSNNNNISSINAVVTSTTKTTNTIIASDNTAFDTNTIAGIDKMEKPTINRYKDSLHSNEFEFFEFTQKQGYEAGIRTVSSIIYKHNKTIEVEEVFFADLYDAMTQAVESSSIQAAAVVGRIKLEETNLLKGIFDPFIFLSTKIEYRHQIKDYYAYSFISNGLIDKRDLGAFIYEVVLSFNPYNKSNNKNVNIINDNINLEIKACKPNCNRVTYFDVENHVVPELQYILNIHIVKKNPCSIINSIIDIIQIEMNKINDEINFIHSLTNIHYHSPPTLEQFQDRVELISTGMKISLKKLFFDDISIHFKEMGWNYDQHMPLTDPPFVVSPENLISTLENIYHCLNNFIVLKLKMHNDTLDVYMNEFYNFYQNNIYDHAFMDKDEIYKCIEESKNIINNNDINNVNVCDYSNNINCNNYYNNENDDYNCMEKRRKKGYYYNNEKDDYNCMEKRRGKGYFKKQSKGKTIRKLKHIIESLKGPKKCKRKKKKKTY
jgi:hypothetical protein